MDQDESLIKKDKYELTLAEFPLFILGKKGGKNIETLEYQDTIKGHNGEIVARRWRVTPNGKYGFPSASAMETFYDLFQIWKDEDFKSQVIHFGSIYNILKRRGLATKGDNYKRIEKDLYQLKGVMIEAKNAFWDNEVKAYVDMAFNLFDWVCVYKETTSGQSTLPLASIKASDVLYGSVKKNSLLLTDFDSKFFHSLTPMEQRFSLYLSKVFRSQTVHKRELLEFASQIPIEAKAKRKIRQTVKDASQGLIEKGFIRLAAYGFEKGKDGQECVVFKRKGVAPRLPAGTNKNNKEPYRIDALVEDILAVCKDQQSLRFYKKVAFLMDESTIYRTISEVKEVIHTGEIQRTPGALFTNLIKKYAKERNIDI